MFSLQEHYFVAKKDKKSDIYPLNMLSPAAVLPKQILLASDI